MSRNKGASFSFFADSEISIRKRGEKSETGGYDSEEMLDTSSEEVTFEIGRSEDEENFKIGLSSYHMGSEKTGEFYHCNMDCIVSKQDLLNIKSYIEALINIDFNDEPK